MNARKAQRSKAIVKHYRVKPRTKRTPVAVFLASTIVVFFLSLSAADSLGLVPDYIDGSTPIPASAQNDEVSLADLPQLGVTDTNASTQSHAIAEIVEPVHIQIPSVGIDLPIQNPATTDVDTLDALLQNGPAHYSQSATLGATGNMIIFAHSSHLPIVHNKMFQAFNNIPDVIPGSTIEITGSDGKTYIYSVDSVVKADTNNGTEIPLTVSNGISKLTLVTCDTLTGKSARFILTADFIGTD